MASRKENVLSLSIAQLVLTIVGVVSGMVFSRVLSVSDYATYLQTFVAYDFATPILTLGLPSALYYFLPRATERQKGIVLDNMVILFVAGAIFSAFLYFGGANLIAERFNNPKLHNTLLWLVLYPLYTFPVIVSAVLVVQNRVTVNAIYNVLSGLVLTSLIIVAAVLTKSYAAPLLVRIIFPLLLFPVAIYFSFKFLPGKFSWPSLTSMKNMLKFSIPLGLASVLGTITLLLANLIVSLLCSPEEYAVFANGAKEVPLVGIITGSIATIIMVDMAAKIKEQDLNSALELFRKSAVLSAIFLFPVMIFLLFYAESFINVLYSSKYVGSVNPFRIYLFILPIRIVYYGSAFVALGKTKIVLYRSIGDLSITAILCFILVKLFGANGAALATILSFYLWSVPYNLFQLGREFVKKPTYILPFKKLGIVMFICVIAGVFSSFFIFFHLNHLIKILSGGMTFFVLYGIMSWNFIPEFKEVSIPVTNSFRRFFNKEPV